VLTALTLVMVGLLGLRHQAAVAHVADQAGRLVHAQTDEALAAHDRTAHATHLHERAPAGHDDGACSLLAVAHQAAVSTPRFDAQRIAAAQQLIAIPPQAPVRTLDGYRLAPKTSPPRVA